MSVIAWKICLIADTKTSQTFSRDSGHCDRVKSTEDGLTSLGTTIMSKPFLYRMKQRGSVFALLLLPILASCTPTVQVAMPNEPITINLNVRIEHEIRVKVERELDDIFSADSGLF